MACTMPPWTWPSMIFGLIAGPQSSTREVAHDVDLAGLDVHVDDAAWAPNGNTKLSGS